MGIRHKLFGPSKDEIWKQFSDHIGATFSKDGTFGTSTRVDAQTKDWTVTLDLEIVPAGKTILVFTRIRAPYINRDGFRFVIYRRSIFSGVAKMLGMQDIEIGHESFDDDFIIQANDESKVRALLADSKLRDLIQAQASFELEVKDHDGYFGKDFPDGVDQLRFKVLGIIKDMNRLRQLYELYAELLEQLCRIGSAYDGDPGVKL
jgi:hypothetical protein